MHVKEKKTVVYLSKSLLSIDRFVVGTVDGVRTRIDRDGWSGVSQASWMKVGEMKTLSRQCGGRYWNLCVI